MRKLNLNFLLAEIFNKVYSPTNTLEISRSTQNGQKISASLVSDNILLKWSQTEALVILVHFKNFHALNVASTPKKYHEALFYITNQSRCQKKFILHNKLPVIPVIEQLFSDNAKTV